MKWRVKVNGTNFRWEFEDDAGKSRVRRTGFITFVFVTADTARAAELRAVEVLRNDEHLRRGLHNAKNDAPNLFVDEVEQVQSFRGCRRPRMPLILYHERGPKRKK